MANCQLMRTVARARGLLAASLIKPRPVHCRPAFSLHQTAPQTAIQVSGFHTGLVRPSEYIINIQDENDFKTRVLKNTTPVVVDFHAGWCGPCKLLGPRLESIISDQQGKVILAKVDIDEHQDLAIEHGVEAVPTVLGMKSGKIVDKFVGVKMDDELNSFIKNLTGE